ncbi:hypothetical protein [Thiocapsa marina]|nr:hypothetical protein [Thiocapsa marina]
MNLVHSEVGEKHSDFGRTLLALAGRSTPSLMRYVLQMPKRVTLPPDSTYMFAFVRHPLDWYESWFKYQSQDTRRWTKFGDEGRFSAWHPNSVLNELGSSDFNVFVENVLSRRPGYVSELYFSFCSPEIRFVGRHESLRKDLCEALKTGNEKYDEDLIMNESAVGVSAPLSSPLVWDPRVRQRAVRLEYAALVRYGYGKTPA